MLKQPSAIALNRFGLGARPGDVVRVDSDPIGALLEELEVAAALRFPKPATPASAATLQRLGELRVGSLRSSEDGIRDYAGFVRAQSNRQAAARYRRAIAAEQPFVERLVHFWANHFAISADKRPVGAIAADYEQEAIRPHVLGNFYDLLVAVETHPAMIFYLDNQGSIGPSSATARAAGERRGLDLGLNENLAREVLELHTLGVGGGYTQADVTELARVLTGWSIGGLHGRLGDPLPGQFRFRAAMHEPGAKQVLGRRYPEQGQQEGLEVLEALALHPSTARHLSLKLARHFVADEPPAELVEALAAAYLRTGGDLKSVYTVLVESPASWALPLSKYKTPHDFVISTFRALEIEPPDDALRVPRSLTALGQRPYSPGSPAGWPDVASYWNGGDALLKRIEWASAVGLAIGDRVDPAALADAVLGAVASRATRAAIANAESGSQGLALLFSAPEFQRR